MAEVAMEAVLQLSVHQGCIFCHEGHIVMVCMSVFFFSISQHLQLVSKQSDHQHQTDTGNDHQI